MNNIKKKKTKKKKQRANKVGTCGNKDKKTSFLGFVFLNLSLSRKREREGLGGDSGGGGGGGREDVWVERGSRWILFLFCFSELLLNDYCC